MPRTDLLKRFGLGRNPFTDRTAEKTEHDETSLYIHSDLRGFKPSETTYVFFGKRGSGKTTIRLQVRAESPIRLRSVRAQAHTTRAPRSGSGAALPVAHTRAGRALGSSRCGLTALAGAIAPGRWH